MMELRRRYVILAAIAAFISWGYATHWVPSIRWIPYSFIAGVLTTGAFVLWAVLGRARVLEDTDMARHYGQSHVKFIERDSWQRVKLQRETRLAYIQEKIYPESPEVAQKADQLLDLVERDFVKSWFEKISGQPTFTNEVDRAIRRAANSSLDRVLSVDIVAAMISRLVPLITTHMHDFYEAERAVRGTKLTRNVTESEGLDMAIAGKFRNGNLHPAVSLAFTDTKLVGQQHLRGIVSRIMPKVLPQEMLTSPAVNVITKELVACAVLGPLIRLLADPDIWHQILENYGRTVLQERKSVRKLRQALEEHAPQMSPAPAPKGQEVPPSIYPKLHPTDSERKFEKWIRSIRKIHTLSDARRFRSEVAIQLRKESMVDNQDAAYLRRLEHGKRMLDKRISQLGAGAATGNTPHKSPRNAHKRNTPSQYLATTLRDILYNATGLSYFMEFMDRQNLMKLVQFWIVVDGIRDPLENEDEDHNLFENLNPELPGEKGVNPKRWTSSDRMDMAQINEGYLSKPEISKCISPVAHEFVKQFLRAGRSATDEQYIAARRAILSAQSAAYEEMLDPYFENFKRSDLWMKFIASEDKVSIPQIPEPIYEPSSNPLPPKPVRSAAGRPTSGSHLAKHQMQQQPDLRRAVVSASDPRVGNRERKPLFDDETTVRTSFESNNSGSTGTGTASLARAPLFEDDIDSDRLAGSTNSLLDSDHEMQHGTSEQQDPKVVDAMQEALNNIMEEGPDKDEDLMRGSMELPPQRTASLVSTTSSHGLPTRSAAAAPGSRLKPSIASLGLVDSAPSNRGVFHEDLFADEQVRFPEDDKLSESSDDEKPSSKKHNSDDDIHEAAPGDLGLAEAIDALTLDIEKLVTQESIVDSLTNKAELTNNAAELRILRKSKASLQREINRKELQRQQYIVQESDSSLHGRATVGIKSVMTGTADDGREFAMYIIEVTRKAGESMPAASWVVARRYSAFHDLHKRLKARYPAIKNLDFPRRQMPMLNLQRDFLERRRIQLERYLGALLENPSICRSRELRAFLSQQQLLPHTTGAIDDTAVEKDFVTRIYNSVTDGMEEFLGNVPVLDQLSVAGQNLISAATSQLSMANTSQTATSNKDVLDVAHSAEAEAELAKYAAAAASIDEPFVKPLCDLFLEMFELNRQSNWLRGRAVVFVLQQILGGTVERRVRDGLAASIFSPPAFARTLAWALDIVWPGGGPRFTPKARTAQEKDKSRKEAGLVLAGLIPELVGSVVGRHNAAGAARKLLAMINNERVFGDLVWRCVDEIVTIVWGEGVVPKGP